MRMSYPLIVASLLLTPPHAMAQSGSVSGSGSGTAGVTTGTGTGGPATGTGNAPGAPNVQMPGPTGTNSLGTAQSSGRGVTTGSASGATAEDEKILEENRNIDRKLRGICRGC